MPKMPVTASMAASRPMTPSATVAACAGNSSPCSVTDQLCTVIGTSGSMPLSVRSSAAAISFGASRERITKTIPLWSFCANGRYTTGCGDSCRSWYLPFSATPTTSVSVPHRMNRCPIAGISPHIFRAKVWFTIATCGVFSVSCHETSRPPSSRVPAASRYPGDIVNTYGASAALFSLNSVVPGRKTGIPCIPPVNGVRLTVPAAVTPGMRRAAAISSCFFSTATPAPCPLSPRSKSASTTPCGWIPSGTWRARTMPRTATSEAVTSSVQIAIWAPNNRSRRANRRKCTEFADPPLIICNGLLSHTCCAGTIPNSSALPSVNARPARYTRASTIASRCTSSIGCHRFNTPSSRSALTRPAAPPISDTITASVSSCLTSRPRLDPRATRSASSRPRSAARAANRVARFAHAAARTSSPSRVTL